MLLVESGSRQIAEHWLNWLSKENPQASVDLLTCWEGAPEALAKVSGAVYSTFDYRTPEQRASLIEEFQRNRYDAIGILCTDEPIMTRWKWYVGWKVHAKLLAINENGDWFWLDRGQWTTIREFVGFRTGLTGSGALTQPLKLLLFPFTLAALIAFTAAAHLRRKLAR